MYWRDITAGDKVTEHYSPRDGQRYILVNGGIVWWNKEERDEAAAALAAMVEE